MDAREIAGMGTALTDFLAEFGDCFGRSEPREHLRTYVAGQLSDLPRKSVEPMALRARVPPRTLQRFLESVEWDEVRLRNRMQRIVARDHADPEAIGVIDETGNPKKGKRTAGVKRQWCGNTGKVDNCVVSVHTGYVAGDFQCLLDSDVYLPEEWAADAARRRAAHIPDDVVFRTKQEIALDQIARGLGNGVRVAAWTFDEFYGRDGAFLSGLDSLGQSYVAEVPSDFAGWVRLPRILVRPSAWELRQPGQLRRFPRLAVTAAPPSEVRRLRRHSTAFSGQRWRPFHSKDSQKGPIVWEVKHADFYRKHGDGLPGPTHTLLVARNVLDRKEVKYFVGNVAAGGDLEKLKWLLHVAFSRFPIEHTFRQAKDELGMDHFEVRGWRSIHRHLYVTQLSHLFCARMRRSLREKKGRARRGGASGVDRRARRVDGRAGPRRGFDLGGGPVPAAALAMGSLSANGGTDRLS
ncbi:MAG: IS701 family transposase, partial [Gammaproteobacteria bacterium]